MDNVTCFLGTSYNLPPVPTKSFVRLITGRMATSSYSTSTKSATRCVFRASITTKKADYTTTVIATTIPTPAPT